MSLAAENILPPLGHNNPPEPLELLRAELKEKHADVVARGAALAATADRLPAECDGAETAAKLAETIKQCNTFAGKSGACELARKVAKQPHLDAGNAVDAFFAGLLRPVEATKAKATALLTAYQQKLERIERERREAEAAEQRRIQREAEAAAREQERIAREAREAEARRQREAEAAAAKLAGEARAKAEAEEAARREAEEARLAAERAEAERAREAARAERAKAEEAKEAANAKAADMARTQTDLGVTASLRTTWTFEVDDVTQVPRHYLVIDQTKIRAAIKAGTDKQGRCNLKIPGVRIFTVTNTVVR